MLRTLVQRATQQGCRLAEMPLLPAGARAYDAKVCPGQSM